MPGGPPALLLSPLIIDIFSRWGYLSLYRCPWEALQLTITIQFSEKEAGILYSASSMSCSIHVSSWEEKVCFLREKGRISIAKESIEQNNTGWMWAFEKVICTKWPFKSHSFLNDLGSAIQYTEQCDQYPSSRGHWILEASTAADSDKSVRITLPEQCHFNHKNLHLYYIIGRLGTWITLFSADYSVHLKNNVPCNQRFVCIA